MIIRALVATALFCASTLALAAQPLTSVPLSNGIMSINTAKGSVSFCVAVAAAGYPPSPFGTCAVIGNVGASTAGYAITPVANGVHAYINNKTTGDIYQCTTAMANGNATPFGACVKAGNSAQL